MQPRREQFRPLVLAAAAAFSLVATRSAYAQSGGSAAGDNDARMSRAVAAYSAQDYATALGLFQQLYIDTRNPALLFNIGQAQDRLHHPDEAARALRQFLRLVPDAPNRADIETQLRRLDAEAAAAAHPTNNDSSANGNANGASGSGNVVVTPPHVEEPSRPIWPLAVAGVGVVTGIVGAVMLGVASGQFGSAQSAGSERDYQTAVDGANGLQTAGWGVLGAGVVLAGAGAVLYFVLSPSEEHAATTSGETRHASRRVVLPGLTVLPNGGVATLTVTAF